MAVDLADVALDQLKRRVNPPTAPGDDAVITASDDEWLGRLADAFCQGRLYGFFPGYRVDPETFIVTNVEGGDDLDQQWVYLIVLFAGLAAVEMQLMNMLTAARQEAPGPLRNEIERSAQVLTEVLKGLRAELETIRITLIANVNATGVFMIDSVLTRTAALAAGSPGVWWN